MSGCKVRDGAAGTRASIAACPGCCKETQVFLPFRNLAHTPSLPCSCAKKPRVAHTSVEPQSPKLPARAATRQDRPIAMQAQGSSPSLLHCRLPPGPIAGWMGAWAQGWCREGTHLQTPMKASCWAGGVRCRAGSAWCGVPAGHVVSLCSHLNRTRVCLKAADVNTVPPLLMAAPPPVTDPCRQRTVYHHPAEPALRLPVTLRLPPVCAGLILKPDPNPM